MQTPRRKAPKLPDSTLTCTCTGYTEEPCLYHLLVHHFRVTAPDRKSPRTAYNQGAIDGI